MSLGCAGTVQYIHTVEYTLRTVQYCTAQSVQYCHRLWTTLVLDCISVPDPIRALRNILGPAQGQSSNDSFLEAVGGVFDGILGSGSGSAINHDPNIPSVYSPTRDTNRSVATDYPGS